MKINLESVRGKVLESRQIEEQGLESAEQDYYEVKEEREIIQKVKETEIEDDLRAKIEGLEVEINREAIDHMESEVYAKLEQGYAMANESIKESAELTDIHRNAADEVQSLSDVSQFGSNAASEVIESAKLISEESQELSVEAATGMDEADKAFYDLLKEF